MTFNLPYTETKDGLSIFIDGEMVHVPNDHQDYTSIKDLIRVKDPDAGSKIKQILERALQAVKAAIAATPSSGVTFEYGVIKYNGEEIHNSLTDRMLRMIDEGFDVNPLANFLSKLQQNPSYSVVERLYEFLEHGKIPITDDGDFLVYKAIRKDWTDIYTGTIDNSVGKVVQVPRNKVDEDMDKTCSHGLHVCSWEYLPHFAHRYGRVIICKVNPADVVAIPRDYNNTKMRVCRYEVVSEYLDYYTKDPHNLLASKAVFTGFQFDDEEDEDEYENQIDLWYDDYCNGRFVLQ